MYNLNYYLLKLFHTIYETKNISSSAEKLFVTQSTVSNGLNRLRSIFNDQLFYRKDNMMVPTNRSISLFPVVTQAMAQFERLSFYEQPFDPKTVASHFRIGISPILQVLNPELLMRMKKYKVTLDVDVLRVPKNSMAVDWHEYDFILTQMDFVHGYERVLMCEDEFIVLMNKHHPLANKGVVDIKDYAKATHVATNYSSQNYADPLTALLNKYQITRNILATTDHLPSMYKLILDHNCLLTSTSSLYQMYKKLFFMNLAALKLNVEPDKVSYYLYYSDRVMIEPSHVWFKNELLSLVRETICGVKP